MGAVARWAARNIAFGVLVILFKGIDVPPLTQAGLSALAGLGVGVSALLLVHWTRYPEELTFPRLQAFARAVIWLAVTTAAFVIALWYPGVGAFAVALVIVAGWPVAAPMLRTARLRWQLRNSGITVPRGGKWSPAAPRQPHPSEVHSGTR